MLNLNNTFSFIYQYTESTLLNALYAHIRSSPYYILLYLVIYIHIYMYIFNIKLINQELKIVLNKKQIFHNPDLSKTIQLLI